MPTIPYIEVPDHVEAAIPASIAAAVDRTPEGEDAAALGALLAHAAGGVLTLVHVRPAPPVSLPGELEAMDDEARELLLARSDAYEPAARTLVEVGSPVEQALSAMADRQGFDLLVLGSSRRAEEGNVGVGRVTERLLAESACPLAIAPRGFHACAPGAIRTIGVGFDGGGESIAGVAFAAGLARQAGARLRIVAAIDTSFPVSRFTPVAPAVIAGWRRMLDAESVAMRRALGQVAAAAGVDAETAVIGERAPEALLELSEEVDLLVIGSRHWGPLARIVLGRAGEALAHGAHAPLLVVPRPSK